MRSLRIGGALAALLLVSLALVAPGCGATSGQVQALLDLDKAKASEYADVSASFFSWADAIEKASPAGSVAREKALETKDYIHRKDARFEQLIRDTARAITALKEIPKERQDALIDDLFRLLDSIQARKGVGARGAPAAGAAGGGGGA